MKQSKVGDMVDNYLDSKQVKTKVVHPIRTYHITCKDCGEKLQWSAGSFDEAGDVLLDVGWRWDDFLGGMVCPKCKID